MLHKGLYSILASGPAKRNGKLYAAQEDTLCIELKQVTKEYGRATVLKNITLTLEEPGIYCLLGRNGAGKTNPLPLYGGRPVPAGGAGGKGLGAHPAGLKIQGVKQVEAHLEPGDGRAEALLLACGFRLAEENTHTARYTCRFETQNWR